MKNLRIPSWIPTLVVALVIFLGVMYARELGSISTYRYQVIQIATITAISALGLNLIYGFNGQFSLGHVGFYAIGAYGSALITKDFITGWSGNQVGALSWIMAAQIGLVSIVALVWVLKIGTLSRRISSHVGQYLEAHEVRMITAIPILLMIGLIIAFGVMATAGLQRVLLFGLDAAITALPRNIAENVIFFLAILNGGTMAAFVAYFVGLPLLRLGSDYFGIATLGFAIMVYTALQNSDMVIETMKGARGMVGIPLWTNWAWVAGSMVVLAIMMRNLLRSSPGRALISVREDEIASQTMGVDVNQLKTLAFAMGGFFAGVGGALYAHLYGFLHPSSFSMIKGFDPLIIIVLGGLGSMTGTILAGVGVVVLIEELRVVLPQGFEDWRFVIYPIILLLVMLLRPQGLMGSAEWGWFRAPLPPERDIPIPNRRPDISPAPVPSEEI